MGGLLGKKALPPFTPDCRKLWDREHALSFDPKRERFELMMDWEHFGLADRSYHQRSHLRIDRENRCFVVDFTKDSTIREFKLADFRELTEIHYRRANYIHEREWPAEDEPAVQVLLLLRFGKHWLRFEQSDYSKRGDLGYASTALTDPLKSLAKTAEAHFSETHPPDRLGWNERWP